MRVSSLIQIIPYSNFIYDILHLRNLPRQLTGLFYNMVDIRNYKKYPKGRNGGQDPFYKSWLGIKERCDNPNRPDFIRYGGRGITYYKRWNNFEFFFLDMFPTYKKGLTIERIDNDGNYIPENCRWATRKEQAQNTRNIERAIRFTFNGTTKTIRQWPMEFGIKRRTLSARLLVYNWTIEEALTKEVNFGRQ